MTDLDAGKNVDAGLQRFVGFSNKPTARNLQHNQKSCMQATTRLWITRNRTIEDPVRLWVQTNSLRET